MNTNRRKIPLPSKPVSLLCGICVLCIEFLFAPTALASPWQRHTIDDSSRGADGVKLLDVNGDGLQDIVTGWEEGGVVRVCLHPGRQKVRDKWPSFAVGKVPSLEDAVFADLDGDGATDVISAAEGRAQRITVHWAPKDRAQYTDSTKWTAVALPASLGIQWMFVVPIQLDGKHGPDFIAGSKGKDGCVGWFEAPADPRDANAWRFHKLRDAGWIMSICATDMNADGRADILFSDRRGPARGAYWLANPGPGPDQNRPWKQHLIGGADKECMFLDHADLDGDGRRDLAMGVKDRDILLFSNMDANGLAWKRNAVSMPETAGRAKGVAIADIDRDGRADLVFSCESATPPKPGVMWMSRGQGKGAAAWTAHDVSGPEGVKFDLVVPIDLDGDGDLDILTCEERHNLGVFWYENPLGAVEAKAQSRCD